ncbi:MAG: YaeQ family protein [Burkholderiaceae bacterium]
MALKSTIYKASLQIADMDRHYYAEHALSIACHPSETLQRMMVRVLVFALHAHEYLEFGKGISDAEEPDLWQKDLTGSIEKWLEVGQPEERRVLKACGKAGEVWIYMYSSSAPVWWKQMAPKLARAKNLRVLQIAADTATELERLCQRNMQLQVTIQDGEIWMRDAVNAVQVQLSVIMPGAH